jgi:hypothetical protein
MKGFLLAEWSFLKAMRWKRSVRGRKDGEEQRVTIERKLLHPGFTRCVLGRNRRVSDFLQEESVTADMLGQSSSSEYMVVFL